MTLQDVINAEISKAEAPTRASASITVPSTSIAALMVESPLPLKRSKNDGNPSKIMVGSRPNYMNTHAEQRVVMVHHIARRAVSIPQFPICYDRRIGIENNTVGQTRWFAARVGTAQLSSHETSFEVARVLAT